MSTPDENFYVLVTGANAGLGFSTCCRLIDEFLHIRPQSQNLTLIITTRSKAKSDDTLKRLQTYLRSSRRRTKNGPLTVPASRIQFESESLDLLSLISVQTAAARIVERYPRLDSLVLNAGIGGWLTVDWLGLGRQICTGFVNALTWPTFKLSSAGLTARPQFSIGTLAEPEPPLGEVFCANVFGHYLLAHNLMPLLSRSPSGRIIWVSTIEAHSWSFSLDNFQCIGSKIAYEGSKRLTDILVLTSDLQSTSPWTDTYFSLPASTSDGTSPTINQPLGRPRMYVCHPGVCATGIMPLHWTLAYAMLVAFYIARWCGSMWHTASPYLGACSPVWLALASEEVLESLESRGGASKWGSAIDISGNERVERTEIEGWGYGGIPGDASRSGRTKGRRPEAKDLTKEDREAFEELGRASWERMETLRRDWEERLTTASRQRVS